MNASFAATMDHHKAADLWVMYANVDPISDSPATANYRAVTRMDGPSVGSVGSAYSASAIATHTKGQSRAASPKIHSQNSHQNFYIY